MSEEEKKSIQPVAVGSGEDFDGILDRTISRINTPFMSIHKYDKKSRELVVEIPEHCQVVHCLFPEEYPLRPARLFFSEPVCHKNVNQDDNEFIYTDEHDHSPAFTLNQLLLSAYVVLNEEKEENDNMMKRCQKILEEE